MAFRESISRLLGRTYTPEAAERIKQLNTSMDEFVRLLHTNGYDGKPDQVPCRRHQKVHLALRTLTERERT